VLLAIAYALLGGLHTIGDFDSGWLMATGRWVLAHGAIPSTDVLSYTSPEAPWHYPPLAGVLLYTIFSAWGYAGLSWFCALACAAVVAYLALRAPSKGVAAPLLAILAVPSLVYRTTPRADLFTTLLFAALLTELWRFHCSGTQEAKIQHGLSRQLWALPVIMLLWVNLHPGVIAGIGLLVGYAALELSEMLFAERRAAAIVRLRRAGPWLVAAVLTVLVNPWGLGLLRTSLALSQGMRRGSAVGALQGEWSGVRLTWRSMMQAFAVHSPDSSYWWLLVVAGAVVLLAGWRRQFGVALFIAAAMAASVQGIRFQGLFAIIVVVLGSTILEENWSRIGGGERVLRWKRYLPAIAAGAICVLAVVRIGDLVSDRSYIAANDVVDFGAGESWWFPERAAAFIEREQLPGNIFQPYNLGGFTALRLGPKYPDYTDGRSVSAEIFSEEQKLLGTQIDSPFWREIADRRKINLLMFSLARVGGLENADLGGICNSSEWHPVYMDEVSVVLLRQRPENQGWIDRFQIDCKSVEFQPPLSSSRKKLFQYYSNTGAVMYALSRDSEAEQSWSRAVSMEPKDPNIHLFLAQLYQQQKRMPEAEREYKAALALKESAVAWYALGRMYAAEHRYSEAEPAIANSAEFSASPANNYKALAQVRLKLKQPELALKSVQKAEDASPFRGGSEKLNPEFFSQLDEARADACRQLGRSQEALNWQQQAVQLTPGVAIRWSRLSELAQADGQTQLAEEAQRRVRELQQSQSGAANY